MDSKINFTLVGAFLFIFILSLVGFSFWLGKYGMDSKKVDLYNTYLEESISGLNVESSIKYKGLNVGVVKSIKINPTNSEQIEVLLEIDYGTPIKEDTVAVLESQGITGLKYIDLVGGSRKAAKLKTSDDYIPVITSKQSFLGSLGDSAQDVTHKIDNILNKLNIMFDEKNIQKISNIIHNTDTLTKNLNSTVVNVNSKIDKLVSEQNINKFNNLFNDLNKFTKQLNKTLANTDSLMNNELKQTLLKVSEASDSTNDAFKEFGKLISDGKLDLSEITSDSLKKFDTIMIELERTMQNAQKSIDNLNDSPSDIIFKSRASDFGPGEKNDN